MDGKLPPIPLTTLVINEPTPSPDTIRTTLNAILQSDEFKSSKRCCDFLSYVVEQTLAGAQNELKERTIAVSVFGRTASYDSHEDAIVRIKASEVRKRLGHFYAGAGRSALVRISLPTGGYVPLFSLEPVNPNSNLPDPSQHPSQTVVSAAESHSDSGAHSNSAWLKFAALAITAVVLASALFWSRSHNASNHTFLHLFWSPALETNGPVYLVAAPAPVFVSYAPGDNLPLSATPEYVETKDQFVGQGDLLASHLVSRMLLLMHKDYEVKAGGSLETRNLSGHAIVLIGYSSTQWESISKELRFFIDSEKAGMITDFGKDTEWFPHHMTKDMHTDEDYAIVSRFFDPSTRAMVVLITGATQYGTEGAARLVTNEELLKNAISSPPPGWERKNLQIVLHMKVIANSPATPETLATYFW
jgi:hypothetical protein